MASIAVPPEALVSETHTDSISCRDKELASLIVRCFVHLLSNQAVGFSGLILLPASAKLFIQLDKTAIFIAARFGKLRGDRLLVATARRPRVKYIGWETVGIGVNDHGILVDSRMRVRDRLWAIGDVTGIWKLTHVGKYQADIAAATVLGRSREANYEAVPRVVFTDPQAAAVGAITASFSSTFALKDVAKTAAYTLAYAESKGFFTLLSDGGRIVGAYALGPEAGEWLQQATLAIRARVPLEVLCDTIQPFPRFPRSSPMRSTPCMLKCRGLPRLAGTLIRPN